ncbi:MAG: Gfo/Idh/MocA family oxidoreductase [Verrucomicrobiae bacterium]|nr:Gfo/Idh/MocA family oxidoreductase [Verrucomicrobiae bacterium]
MNLLVIGTGSIGERHLRCFQQLGRCETIAFCETRDEQRAAIAERYGIPGELAFSNLDAALESERFDAAVIATPAPTHIPIGTRLAELGIHQLMEKPLSLSLEGVDAYARLIEERVLVVAVGYVHRAHPAVGAVKEALDSGRFGRPLQLRMSSGQAFAVLRPAYRDVYFAKSEMGGGAINDMITHLYNVGDWLAGPIEKIVTDADHQALDGVTVEDTVHSLTRQGYDVMGSYTLNLYQQPNEVLMTVVCEKGTVQIEYAKKRWSWMTEPGGEWHHEPVEMPEVDVMYRRQNAAFLNAIKGKGEVLCSLEDAIRTLHVNLASHRSVTEGAWQDVIGGATVLSP